MKREDLHKKIREKFLFEGPSGTGKTNISMKITKIYAMNKKKVLYIDPETGSDRDLKMFDSLDDDELSCIQMEHATNIETYLRWMLGWVEDKSVGSQEIKISHGIEYDLKVCDGLGTEMELYKTKLTQRFLKQGFYEIGGSKFTIPNPDTFVLPYNFYGKLYDQIKEALVIMMDHKYDIVATLHPLKSTESQQDLQQSIYQKFDSVIRLNKILLPQGTPKWNANIVKNRGRESPDKSNVLDSVDPLVLYFIKKFDMDTEETMKRL